ncbi:hypothetical protein [Leucobacter chinensis]|uniref:hypothetical protein n=1 Tax=Leucobacter chinensis TaxID=2851010 RepID=UPI001C2192C7|nr:hypothetical protein [Leucobacter chinensis]
MSAQAHETAPVRDRVLALVTSFDPRQLATAEELLERLAETSAPSTHNLTVAEVSALERFGVTTNMAEQQSHLSTTAQSLLTERRVDTISLSATEVASLLHVSTARVRQRAADHTLLARRHSDGWHFPAFQFFDGGELPGWSTVAKEIPPTTPLTLVERALTWPSSLLTIDSVEHSIASWLQAGGSHETAAQIMQGELSRAL